jgi:hypothetical protein
MVDWLVRLATPNIWLDRHMVGLTVNLGEILIQDLSIASNDGSNDVRITLNRLLIGNKRSMNESDSGSDTIVLFGSC